MQKKNGAGLFEYYGREDRAFGMFTLTSDDSNFMQSRRIHEQVVDRPVANTTLSRLLECGERSQSCNRMTRWIRLRIPMYGFEHTDSSPRLTLLNKRGNFEVRLLQPKLEGRNELELAASNGKRIQFSKAAFKFP